MKTQEQIDSIRERMCEEYCGVIGNNNLSIYVRKEACDNCPLNELEASAEPKDWMEQNKDIILQAGMEGREVEFRIDGRLFAIREKPQ